MTTQLPQYSWDVSPGLLGLNRSACIQVPYASPHPLMVSLPCSRFSFWFLRLLKANLSRKNQGKCGIFLPVFSVSSITRSPSKLKFFLIFLPIEACPVDLCVFSENHLPCEFLTLIPGFSDSVTIFLLGTHICKLMTTIICTLLFYLFS